MNLTQLNGTSFDKLGRLVAKVLRYGAATLGMQAAPYGIDSNPIAGMVAIYAESKNQGQPIILGYLNVNGMAAAGEIRIFATDSDGNLQGSVWCKNNGAIDIKATGDTTQPITLNSGSSPAVLGDKLTTSLNDIVQILTTINTWGSSVTPPLPSLAIPIAQLQLDIQQIESQNVTLD